jgi:hypothetical protein
MSICVQFVDDILLASKSEEAHLFHLECILKRVTEASLVLNPNKCNIMQKRVEFCGKQIDKYGILPRAEDLKRLAAWPTPMTKK